MNPFKNTVLWEEYTTVLKYLLCQPTPRKVHGVDMAFGRVQMSVEQNPPDYPNKRTQHESGHHRCQRSASQIYNHTNAKVFSSREVNRLEGEYKQPK
mmetsp:Transcript_18564/g.33635  ORF Transcript_18564/g.33635 Transcript_18564/m.33635 type:complete len:97 (-) Transcript_18564:1156-1446(-)